MEVAKRNRLAELLAEAAEFEHNILCQYLFAAFSMRKHPDEGRVNWAQLEQMRRWEGTIMLVARQEMEHLGLVTNLLTAIGEAPYLRRPDFPLRARHYPVHVPSHLERLTLDTVLRFIRFEMPQELSPANEAFLRALIPDFDRAMHDSIANLYDEIATLFEEIDPRYLFIGPPSAQFDTLQVIPMALRGVTLADNARIYDVSLSPVYDVESALHAVAQITEEGEGTSRDDEDSHFARFLEIYKEFQVAQAADPTFDPARPVISTPKRADHEGPHGPFVHLITDPATIKVSELFDLAYATMMLMLMRFFARTDESQAELAGLQQSAFFPMMTSVIRPLGEILTQLPAYAGQPATKASAGPSFEFGRRVALLPHREASWELLSMQLELMREAAGLLQHDPAYPDPIRTRLAMIHQNIARMYINFNNAMGLGEKE